MSFTPTERTRVRRLPERGHYDRATVYPILDEAFICHIGFVADGKPVVIPTLFGREGDTVYFHGSAASRMLRSLKRASTAASPSPSSMDSSSPAPAFIRP